MRIRGEVRIRRSEDQRQSNDMDEVSPSFLTALISWASLLVVIDVAGQGGNARTVAVVASRAGLSPSLS